MPETGVQLENVLETERFASVITALCCHTLDSLRTPTVDAMSISAQPLSSHSHHSHVVQPRRPDQDSDC